MGLAPSQLGNIVWERPLSSVCSLGLSACQTSRESSRKSQRIGRPQGRVECYLEREGFKGLQIDSGPHKHAAWLNSDLPGSGAEIGIDVTEELLFPDGSLHAIYGCEVIEHIPKDAVLPFLKEAFRVLRSNGVFRLTTPDLEEVCRNVLGISDECSVEQISTIWLEDKNLTRDISRCGYIVRRLFDL